MKEKKAPQYIFLREHVKNPYIPLDVENPSVAQKHQKTLRGPGMEERRSILKRRRDMMNDLMSGKTYDKEVMLEFVRHLALDVAREKKRIGGDFAVAAVLLTEDVRDQLREILGGQLTIVSLTMSEADRRTRLLQRHGGNDSSADVMEVSER